MQPKTDLSSSCSHVRALGLAVHQHIHTDALLLADGVLHVLIHLQEKNPLTDGLLGSGAAATMGAGHKTSERPEICTGQKVAVQGATVSKCSMLAAELRARPFPRTACRLPSIVTGQIC